MKKLRQVYKQYRIMTARLWHLRDLAARCTRSIARFKQTKNWSHLCDVMLSWRPE